MPSGRHHRLLSTWLVAATLLAACADSGGGAGGSQVSNEPTNASNNESPTANGLPPDPQTISFTAADGEPLQGIYYPAATSSAPIVVLQHWANGDLSDWYEVAPWLQNRGLDNPFTNPGTEPWWDPSWFPSVPEDLSVGVFIFTFRGCEPFPTGCRAGSPEEWLLDAQAGLLQAASLDGADPTRISAIGSSIGADGAVDACFMVNEESPGMCDGALSLSPGDWLNVSYVDAVANLGASDPPVPAWCLASGFEIAICDDAQAAGNGAFQSFEIINGEHGNFLMVPDAEPSTMQTMLDFLRTINFH